MDRFLYLRCRRLCIWPAHFNMRESIRRIFDPYLKRYDVRDISHSLHLVNRLILWRSGANIITNYCESISAGSRNIYSFLYPMKS